MCSCMRYANFFVCKPIIFIEPVFVQRKMIHLLQEHVIQIEDA
jgi:hypothetical protein